MIKIIQNYVLSLLCGILLLSIGSACPAQAPIAVGQTFATYVEGMLAEMKSTQYQHTTEIDEAKGSVKCDCSGLIGYALRRSVPEAYIGLKSDAAPWRSRPLAATFYETMKQAEESGNGAWRPVPRVMDARPGDVFAWRRSVLKKGSSTGHVMMIAGVPVKEEDGRIRVRVIDSTGGLHANDTRAEGETGMGAGDMWLTVNSAGEPTGFYNSERQKKSKVTQLAIGRLKELGDRQAASEADQAFIGLSQAAAIALAKTRKLDARVILQEGQVQAMNMKVREDRLNFVIIDGKVVRVRRG